MILKDCDGGLRGASRASLGRPSRAGRRRRRVIIGVCESRLLSDNGGMRVCRLPSDNGGLRVIIGDCK